MSHEKITLNRPLVGILALGCFAAALLILLTQSNLPSLLFSEKQAEFHIEEAWWMWLGGFVRVGVVLSAIWLALPNRHREAAWANVSPWSFILIVLAVAAVAVRPKVMIPLLFIVAVVGFLLRPRKGKRRSSRSQ